jgi:hypothetical protein
MKQVVEVGLELNTEKINGKSPDEINAFLQSTVMPILLDGLTERSRGGEVGCSVHDGGWDCHATIRF